jgi:hypothetical protein
MVSQMLSLEFGNSVICIRYNDAQLQQALHCCFRPGLIPSNGEEDTTAPVSTYFLNTLRDGRLELQRENELLYRGASSSFALERLMQDVTMTLAVQCREHLVFHAAGLAYGEQGLIFCGESGSGKSTLAAQLITAGFDYLTDELVAIKLDASEMIGFTRPLVLRAGSAFVWRERLAEVNQRHLLRFSEERRLVDPELLRPRSIRISVAPRILLFSRYLAGQPFAVQSLSRAEAVFELMRCLLNAKNLPQGGLSSATHLIQQLASYRLTYSDINQMVTWLEQCLAQL